MLNAASHQITLLLIDWSKGDEFALEQLTPLVYDELRQMARHYMRRQPSGHTFQTTELIHEAYLKLAKQDGALEQGKKTSDLEPNFPTGRWTLGAVYDANGMYAEAIALSEKSLQSDPTNQIQLGLAGYAYAKSGRRREAEEIIGKFREIAKTQYVSSYWIAVVYVGVVDKNQAFAELEKAFDENDWHLHRLKVDPLMDSLRADPRFKDLLKRMNLPE